MDFCLFMKALLTGGAAFATPEGEAMGKPVKKGWIFQLHEKAHSSRLKWAPTIPLKLDKSPSRKDFPKTPEETDPTNRDATG
jgi:hypothetical protein